MTISSSLCIIFPLFSIIIDHSESLLFLRDQRRCFSKLPFSKNTVVVAESNTFQTPTVEVSKSNFESSLVQNGSTAEYLIKLDTALRFFNTTSASNLLCQIRTMRDNNTEDSKSPDRFLNELLSNGPDRPLPVWTIIRPLARFSKRARLASLRRTLDITTPPPSSTSSSSDNDEDSVKRLSKEEELTADPLETDRLRRRRRAFVSLLRTLSSPPDTELNHNNKFPAIRIIESKAINANKANEDLALRRPRGLETPNYDVVLKRSNRFEIRKYQPYSICSVSMTAPRPIDSYRTDAKLSEPKNSSGTRAFGALAGYLFGKNDSNQAMKMTTPVLTKTIPSNNNNNNEKQMSFVLPSEYWNDDGIVRAPKPLRGSGVELVRMHGEIRAVQMFGGYASTKEVEYNKKQLLSALAKEQDWEIVNRNDTITLAQYNDPFTAPWQRLNEVSIVVQPRQHS